MKRRVSVRAIVMRDNKLLCVRQKPYTAMSASIKNRWCVPGGGLDEGEPLVKGLEREIFEETGIRPKVGSLLYIQQFVFNDKEHMELFFNVTNPEDFLDIDLSKTSHGGKEIEEIAFVDPTITDVLPVFLTTENITEHISNNSPTAIFSYL